MRFNIPIGIIAFMFWWEETVYFGWNRQPHSIAELAADGFCALLWCLAFLRAREGGL